MAHDSGLDGTQASGSQPRVAGSPVPVTRWPAPAGAPYSRAVRAGRFIYVSGVAPLDREGRVIGAGDVKAQTRAVLDALGQTLRTAGGTLDRAASVHVYLRRAADFAAMNEIYATYWKADPPARTTIVAGLVEPDTLVAVSAVGITNGAPREVIHPEGWIKSPNPYSYAIKSGDTLFLSGLVPRSGLDNKVVEGDMTTQTKAVMENATAILKSAGMSFADVVSSRVFITDGSVFQDMNTTYRTAFPKEPPARATVICELMNPAFKVEITMVAVAGGTREALSTPNADGTPRPPNPNLSAAIRTGDRVFLSGMLGNNETNKGDVAAQARETLAAVGRTLRAAGLAWKDVVDAVVYVTDASQIAAVDTAWREVFGAAAPTRTVLGTGLVAPDGLVEIMVTAVR